MSRWRWLTMADPVHGIIQFDRKDPIHRLMLETVNCRAFQRLRRVRQMGLAEFVFPGAVHSRFNHSLGAAYLMSKVMQHFRHERDSREQLNATFEDTGISFECLLMMGILLHDVAHPPLSHTLEDVLHLGERGFSHDHYWMHKILSEEEELLALWQRADVPNLPDALQRFLGHKQPKKHFFSTLVSSQLDMDRLDYLLRDSHFLGVKYGNIESDRIISCLEIATNGEQEPLIAVSEDALPAVEHYLFGRHQAYKMALHSLDKAAESLLRLTLKRFFWAREQGIDTGHPMEELYRLHTRPEKLTTPEYLRMDDCYLWEGIHCWSLYAKDPLLKTLADRLMTHNLPKFVDLMQFTELLTAGQRQQLLDDLAGHYAERGLAMEFCYDEAYVRPKPMYMRPPLREAIWIATRNRGVVELSEVSPLAQSVEPSKGHKDLIFVWDNEAQRFLRNRIKNDLLQ